MYICGIIYFKLNGMCEIYSHQFLVKGQHVTETLTIRLLIFSGNNNLKADVSTQYFQEFTFIRYIHASIDTVPRR
jgi:hypothetical protein